jgi:hypothetical protein
MMSREEHTVIHRCRPLGSAGAVPKLPHYESPDRRRDRAQQAILRLAWATRRAACPVRRTDRPLHALQRNLHRDTRARATLTRCEHARTSRSNDATSGRETGGAGTSLLRCPQPSRTLPPSNLIDVAPPCAQPPRSSGYIRSIEIDSTTRPSRVIAASNSSQFGWGSPRMPS